MKFSTFSGGALLGLSLILAVSAFTSTKDHFQIGNPVNVTGKVLKPGDYTIEWKGSGPTCWSALFKARK
jgi:hypothetical protein